MTWFLAKLNLALHFFIHLIRQVPRLFLRRESRLEAFQKNYFTEAPIWTLSAEERQRFQDFSACINCSICELDCFKLQQDEILHFKPKWVPLMATRYTPDYEYALSLANVCTSCSGCTVQCPAKVPIKEMAQFISNKVHAWKTVKEKLQ